MILRSDPAEVARAIRVLFQSGDVVEMRIPKTEREGVVSGYFSDHAALAKAVVARNGDPGIYVAINPVIPALLARCSNRIKSRVRVTTSDKDIIRRRWLPIDCDPARPADISSTDEEHEAALERARDIRMMLSEEGWPAPILADSGNGAHLLYPIDLPNDAAATALVAGVLAGLAKRFDDMRVKIDPTMSNAARICKCYGTISRKGDDTPDRPHRLSKIIDAPNTVTPVPRELLEEMAATVTPAPAPVRNTAPTAGRFDLEGFVARHLQAREPVAYQGGRKWVLEACPFNPEHIDGSAAIFESGGKSLGFKCQHHSCHGKHWQDVRALFEPRAERRQPEPHQTATPTKPEPPKDKRAPFQLIVRAAAEIYDADYPEPVAIVPPILYPGLTLLAGRTKVGKSWLAMDLALSLVQGTAFGGHLNPPDAVLVLYVSLEERPRQTRARLRKLTPQGEFLRSLQFIHELPPLMSGGAAVLDAELVRHPARVVIVDSLLGITKAAGRKNMDALQTDYNIVNTLREVAERNNVGLVLIAHTRKAAGDYFVDLVQGTTGTTAAADAVWVLLKKSDGTGILNVTGREVEDRIYGLRREGPLWRITGEGEEFTQTEERGEILELLRENGAMKPMAIARALQKRVPAIQKLLRKLLDDGLVTRKKYGEYQLLGGGTV
jgi:hypothetical protein